MKKVVLIQLPIPGMQFGEPTGNIPLAAGCLKTAVMDLPRVDVVIVPESVSSFFGDRALLDHVIGLEPEIVGFTVYNWNLERSLFIAGELKRKRDVRIVFGGPEITPDNPLLDPETVDFHVFGEGEAVFRELLTQPEIWERQSAFGTADSIFQNARTPYLFSFLEPGIEDTVLIETQRGCPHRCGFCYYNKSRKKRTWISKENILETIRWVREKNISEVFLLDPCLDARKDLGSLLKEIARINPDKAISFQSEVRAESIDAGLADTFAEAGFTGFEIGLQSTSENALKIMNRLTDIDRFLTGVGELKRVGILPRIDLIIGLPGDDLEGFKRSVDFVFRHGLQDDVQVFYLSVLPGTSFRTNSAKLGLRYLKKPPYTVISSEGFTMDEMFSAFCYAEEVFDVCLEPGPGLDLSFRNPDGSIISPFVETSFSGPSRSVISKVVLNEEIPLEQVESISHRLSYPWQLIIGNQITDHKYLKRVLETCTEKNPYTPFEMVFINPGTVPDIENLQSAIELVRPMYLDRDFPALASGSVLITVVIPSRKPVFRGVMKRQVFLWDRDILPGMSDLRELFHLDGILIDTGIDDKAILDWQNRFAGRAGEIPYISFSRKDLGMRWKKISAE